MGNFLSKNVAIKYLTKNNPLKLVGNQMLVNNPEYIYIYIYIYTLDANHYR